MNLVVGKYYKISLSVGGKLLTYTCVIKDIDDTFIEFVDKYNQTFNYNKKLIISFKELNEDEIVSFEKINKGDIYDN